MEVFHKENIVVQLHFQVGTVAFSSLKRVDNSLQSTQDYYAATSSCDTDTYTVHTIND